MIYNIIIILLFLAISENLKNDLNMIYFIPSVVLLLIYLNTSKYEHYEHFLCKLVNSITNIFSPNRFFGKIKNKLKSNYNRYGPNALINNVRNRTRDNLLKINKNAENIILKI
jgi:hypothetical protein